MTCHPGKENASVSHSPGDHLLDGNQTKGIEGGRQRGGSANAVVEMRVRETNRATEEGGQTENGPWDAWETSNIDRVSSTKRRTDDENNEARIEAS